MTEHCFHCQECVPTDFNAPVVFDGELRQTCCYGCQAVMQAIVDAGLSDYYQFRTDTAVPCQLPADIETGLDTLRIYDEPELAAQLLKTPAVGTDSKDNQANAVAEVTLSVDGIRCGACVWLLERILRAIPGVEMASVNGSTHRARICFDRQVIALSGILQRIQQVGYQALPLDTRQREQRLLVESRRQIQRLFVAGIAMMQVMMYALPGYLSDDGQMVESHRYLLNWAGMVLTVPVMIFSALPFFSGALRGIRTASVGMDVPVSIGIMAAFSASVWSVISQRGQTYFDSVSMFVFLLLLARYVEWSIRCRSVRSIDDISQRTVDTAHQLINGSVRRVPAARLNVDDTIRVSSGDAVPVNGIVLNGQTTVDCSVISGESRPITFRTGDEIPGGSVVAGNPVDLRVVADQQHSTLSLMANLVERGNAEKPLLVTHADRIAHYFVLCVLCFAALVFALWWLIDPARSAIVAITVMIVSCPCALSLATPAALAASTSKLLGLRLLITRGHVLETAAKVTDIVFDKTGTLTHGSPFVLAVDYVSGATYNPQAMAAALEESAAHPYARAIRELYTSSAHSGFSLTALKHKAGSGVGATLLDDCEVRIGSRQWCRLSDRDIAELEKRFPLQTQTSSQVYLCESKTPDFNEPRVIARFSLADKPRQDAADIIALLKNQGYTIHLLSGDQDDVVAETARALHIDNHSASASPEDKQHYVSALQAMGARVMMIGDGINDAPVLATSDVSVAIGEATGLARTSADVIALSGDLNVLPVLLKQAHRTVRIVKQNLLWALAYNATVIPAAALGLVSPWLAAIGMAASSLLVAVNAGRLWLTDKTLHPASALMTYRRAAWNH